MTNWVVGGDDEGLNIEKLTFFVIEYDQVGCIW